MASKSIAYRIFHFPLTRIIIGITVCVCTAVGAQWLIGKGLAGVIPDKQTRGLVTTLLVASLTIAAYIVLFRFYDKRKVTELNARHIMRNLLSGMVLGAVLQSLTILVMWANGFYSVISVNPIIFLLSPLTMAFGSAIFEEILLRGILFRIMEEKLGSYMALVVSAIIFGALHLANPNSSIVAATGLAIQAGLLLGAAFMYARSLWFPIAIHFAWNFTQSGIFGARVSGNSISETLVTSHIEGPEWITGGAFGPEGSIQATLFCLAATIVLMFFCHKENKIIRPFWKKRNGSAITV